MPRRTVHQVMMMASAVCLLVLFFVSSASGSTSHEAEPTPHSLTPSATPSTHPESHPRDRTHVKSTLQQVKEGAARAAASASSNNKIKQKNINEEEDEADACYPQPYNFGSYSYCGANYYTSATYPVPSGGNWSLKNVQLVTRHGDRTPVNILPTYDVAYPFCETTATLGFYVEPSVQAEGIGHVNGKKQHHHHRKTQPEGRRLERIPFLAQPSVANPYASQLWQGSCMTGQLTTFGVQQLQTIGRALHDIYVTQLGFLPATYSRANTSFYLRTTDVWRTRQSAESLLSGLWPSTSVNDDLIPLHSFPQEIETMYANPLACDELAQVQSEQMNSAPWVGHLNQPEIWSELDSVLGTKDLPDWHLSFDHFFDNFKTRQCHELPLPCQQGNSSNCISQDTADFVYNMGDWEYRFLMNESPLATQNAQLGIGAFMSVIRDTMVAQVTGNASVSTIGLHDFQYYSGHDTTIAAVLGALNITGMRWPPYASNLIFELWQQTAETPVAVELDDTPVADPGSNYFVRVLYNGVILPIYAAGCCDDMCPYDSFINYLNTMIPANLVEICQGDGIRKMLKHH